MSPALRTQPTSLSAFCKDAPCVSNHLRNDRVAEAVESVQPIGYPINHSVNNGERTVLSEGGAEVWVGSEDGGPSSGFVWARRPEAHDPRIGSKMLVPEFDASVSVVWRGAFPLVGVGQIEAITFRAAVFREC